MFILYKPLKNISLWKLSYKCNFFNDSWRKYKGPQNICRWEPRFPRRISLVMEGWKYWLALKITGDQATALAPSLNPWREMDRDRDANVWGWVP